MALDGGKVLAATHLKKALLEQLEMALDLIARLDDKVYSGPGDGRGSIGSHLRHNLNFVEAVIDGALCGSIDYGARTRDRRVETDRSHASSKVRSLMDALARIPIHLAEAVTVTSELNPRLRLYSTLGRELEFAISHTVHHYALIRERLLQNGIHFEPQFGVAPSTLEYWRAAGQ